MNCNNYGLLQHGMWGRANTHSKAFAIYILGGTCYEI